MEDNTEILEQLMMDVMRTELDKLKKSGSVLAPMIIAAATDEEIIQMVKEQVKGMKSKAGGRVTQAMIDTARKVAEEMKLGGK